MNVTLAQAGVQFKDAWIPACQTVSQLSKRQMLLFCHSGLDPESSSVSGAYVSGCRIKSGMTVTK
jgi:ketopantoate hydroxymethyltransferase